MWLEKTQKLSGWEWFPMSGIKLAPPERGTDVVTTRPTL